MKKINEHKYYGNPSVFKAVSDDAKTTDDSRVVSFYAANFGTKDYDSDILIQGCFAKSISEHGPGSESPQKIAYLYQHDMSEPLGRITLLREDSKGLYVEVELDEIDEADRVLTQYKSGTLNQHSIGFRYIWDKVEYDDVREAYIVKEVQLFEVSVVTVGANENTPFEGFKAADIEDEQTKINKEIDKFLKGFDISKQYEARKLFSRVKSLSVCKPDKKSISSPEPKAPEIDLSKIAELLQS